MPYYWVTAATGLDSATTATTLSSDPEGDNTTSGDELRSSAVELTAVGARLKVEAADQPQDWFDTAEDGSNVQRSSSFTHARLFHLLGIQILGV